MGIIIYYYGDGALWTEDGMRIGSMTLGRAHEIALEDDAELREGLPE